MIHKYTLFSTNIVVDVNSGAVHVFDKVSFDILDYYKTYDFEEIVDKLSPEYGKQAVTEAYGEIQELEKQGLIFSNDIYEEEIRKWNKKSVVKAMCLHVAHDCNMRCKYCFASTGHFGVERKLMPEDTAKKAIDFVIQASEGRKNIEIDFFGGEPLLNFDVVKKTVEYAREQGKKHGKNFRFTITTNALDLTDDHISYFNENMSNVVLSIDGRPEINDNMRMTIEGSGTYSHILPNIKNFVQSRGDKDYYVRGTFTRENLDFSKDVIHLADCGFGNISVEPVVAAKSSGLDIREQDIEQLFKEYEKLAMEYILRKQNGEGFNFFHFMIDLSQGPCAAKRLAGCGAGDEYVAVTPEGDIYPCHQFVGISEFKLGNVYTGVVNHDIRNKFKTSNVYTKPKCNECWAKFYCSGGCFANAFAFNNDISIPYEIGCELEKKRVECALWIQAKMAMK